MKIEFGEWLKKETQKMNFSAQEHHPYFHYIGATPSCPKCNPNLETPKEIHKRLNPKAICNGKELHVEVLDKEDIIELEVESKEEEKPGIKEKIASLVTDSDIWGRYRENRIKKKESILEKVNKSLALKPKGLKNQNVLCLPDVGYTRSLSVIQCLIEMEERLGEKIHSRFDVISGTGNSAIIAACAALGMSMEDIKTFFVNKWINAYKPNIFYSTLRKVDSINPFSQKKYGFSSEKARKILTELFKVGSDSKIQRKFYDLKTEVYIPAAFARYKESFAYTKVTSSDLPLVDALCDVCLDPFHFDTKETVKDRGIPLPIEDVELRIMQENKDVILTKIDVPFLHLDHGNLNNATAKELAPAIRDLSGFINKLNIESHANNFHVKRIKYECDKISDSIPKNSTNIIAINSAIEAGKAVKQKSIGMT